MSRSERWRGAKATAELLGAALAAALGLLPSSVEAATIDVTCSGDITTALSNATSAAKDGDVVNIKAGTCAVHPVWDKRVGWTDKNLVLQGAGRGSCTGQVCTCNPVVDTCLTTEPGLTSSAGINTSNLSGDKMRWRITNLFLTSTSNAGGFYIVSDGYGFPSATPGTTYGWRVDHVTFYYPNTCGPHALTILGTTYGLIDHNTFVFNCESAILTDPRLASEDGSIDKLYGSFLASKAFEPGGLNNLYIEDNVFVHSPTGPDKTRTGYAAIDTGYSGGRIVFRHNTLENVGLYAHWTSSTQVNSLWWEIYANRFSFTYTGDWLTPMRLHGGGTGLIYDNIFTGWPVTAIRLGEGRLSEQGQSGSPLGYCDDPGGHAWDGAAGDPAAQGWPCLAQTGRAAGKTMAQIRAGQKQESFPLYLWNNGPQEKCLNPSASGAACDNSFGVDIYSGANYFRSQPHSTTAGTYGKGDVDYCIVPARPAGCGTHSLVYAPQQYPHPLQGAASPRPAAPTRLRVF